MALGLRRKNNPDNKTASHLLDPLPKIGSAVSLTCRKSMVYNCKVGRLIG